MLEWVVAATIEKTRGYVEVSYLVIVLTTMLVMRRMMIILYSRLLLYCLANWIHKGISVPSLVQGSSL